MAASIYDYNYMTIFEGIWLYAYQAPTYHVILELLLVGWIVKLLFFSKQYNPEVKNTPTREEEEELIKDWIPEPLTPPCTDDKIIDDPIVSGVNGTKMTVNGQECINLATFNFLGLLSNKNIRDSATSTIRKYGVGSCNPRAFYGTMDVHLSLEKEIAKFTHREDSVTYSFGFAAISSAIPAYSKRNDIVFCDEGVSFAIQKGLTGSRSKICFFKHNDMNDLERLLIKQQAFDLKNPSKAKQTRRFIVAEGLYMNSGDLAPLDKLVEFRSKYKVPIILEESVSFGVLGATGRGAVEHFGLSPEDVDVICVSMGMSLASIGGFCAGKTFVIDHQRLCGLGYCFSASTPPYLATAAIKALKVIDESPELLTKLRENTEFFRKLLQSIKGVEIKGHHRCPIIHVSLKESKGSRQIDQKLLDQIVTESQGKGLAIVTAKYLESEEHKLPDPSIRLTVSSEHSEDELKNAASILKTIIESYI